MSARDLTAELAEHEAKRNELITQDRRFRLDSQNAANVSALEKDADRTIREIRAEEAATIWAQEYPSIPHPFPGMEFLTGRSIIIQTKLYKILQKMPKGALLHAHLDATVDASFLLELGLQEPAIHVRAPQVINAATLHFTLPEFLALPPESFNKHPISLTDAKYTPQTWVPIQHARSSFDASLGGPEGFDEWVLRAMTINPAEAYGTHNTVTKIWQKFTTTFLVARGFIHYIPIYAKYIRQFLLSSIEDNIAYVEPRINFWSKHLISAEGVEDVTHRDFLLLFDSIVKGVKAEMEQQGRGDQFVGAKIIYTTLRFIEADDLDWYLKDCIALKKEFPHLIVGFDLVGDENVLHPLSYYMTKLLEFRYMQEEAGVDIPFVFHAGETLGDGTDADMNLYDAILLGTKRIGHGFSLVKHPELMKICRKLSSFSLVKHPELMKICRERDITLEVCPISNEILRLTSSMPLHPLPILLNNGVPVSLCSDDPSVFGNMGLTFDFFQVLAASEITGILQLGAMARDSFSHSLLDPEHKTKALADWSQQWNKFLEFVVKEGKSL